MHLNPPLTSVRHRIQRTPSCLPRAQQDFGFVRNEKLHFQDSWASFYSKTDSRDWRQSRYSCINCAFFESELEMWTLPLSVWMSINCITSSLSTKPCEEVQRRRQTPRGGKPFLLKSLTKALLTSEDLGNHSRYLNRMILGNIYHYY